MRGLIYLLTLSAIVFAVGCKGEKKVIKGGGYTISISDSTLLYGGVDSIKLGHMQSGEVVRKKLFVENNSSQNIVISSYYTSCGCTTFDYQKKPITPAQGEEAFITYNSRGFWGRQLKVVRIEIAGAKKPYLLYIEAEINR